MRMSERQGSSSRRPPIKGYKKIIRNHIRPQLGSIRLDKLTATRIARHYRDLEDHGRRDEYGKGKPLSANSIHKVHVVLGATLDAAIDDGHLTVNPAKKRRTVKPPKSSEVRAQKPEIATWTTEQLQTFLTWNRDEVEDELFPSGGSSPTPACAVRKPSP